MEAIILAGGLGTRLSKVIYDVPKPMAPVAHKPFLEYILTDIARKGIGKTVLAVGYKREYIKEYFGKHFMGMEILYSEENTPLFTGGAIKKASSYCDGEEVFVINGDTFFDVPLQTMLIDFLCSNAQLSIAVKEMFDVARYGTVYFNEDHWIEGFEEKKPKKQGYINGGIYLLATNMLIDYPDVFSFEKQVIESKFEKHRMRVFPSDGYFIDIGIPEDYSKAQNDFA